MESQNNKWAVLAGVRFFLALSVVSCHCNIILGAVDAGHVLWTFGGLIAVVGFFIISGYSIAHSIEHKPNGYAQRRFVRIYPLFFVSLLFGFLPFAFFGHSIPLLNGESSDTPTLTTFLTTLFMLNGILYTTPIFVHPLWSLSCEGIYYCFAPSLRKLSSQSLFLILLVSATLYIFHVYRSNYSYPDEVHGISVICLFWAWLIGFAFFQFRNNYKLLIALALLGTAMISWYPVNEGSLTFVTYFLVILALLFADKITIASKWQKPLNYLGELSYPLYLTHWTVLIILSRMHLISLGYAAVPICWACALVVSMAFYHLIDAPIRRRYSTSKIKNQIADVEPQQYATPA